MTVNQNNFATTVGGIAATALILNKPKLAAGIATAATLVSAARKLAAGFSSGANTKAGGAAAAWTSSGDIDWRVKLSVPENFTGTLMTPIQNAGGFIFPFTPTVNITHTANYNTMDPVHSNYPFLSYENSKVDQITIAGDFYCENSVHAMNWISSVHYLRTVTKMAFGNSSNAGQPPPVVKLTGYGDYVFSNVPVVVKSFTVDLPKDVDYISAALTSTPDVKSDNATGYAPVKSTISVVVQPIYSREQTRNFSLDSFVRGDYVLKANQTGFL